MPKISAANIEEHIRVQNGRILDAARALFSANGYRGTDMGDIAKAMGLARNSLYRYYSNKDHILVAVMQRDMIPYVARNRVLEDEIADPRERIDAWLDLQIELATGPCHASIKMLGDMREASPELRQEMGAVHEPPGEVLNAAVAQLMTGSGRDVRAICAMISGMVQAAGALAMESSRARSITRELKHSVGKILDE
ncbi:MAG: TetR/AcrR family transcriptional regulator [Gammaproteobacteria bacterium]|nr:TetR/AcrR family transcriptional regulator [Gammaproteobacteria bacterium]